MQNASKRPVVAVGQGNAVATAIVLIIIGSAGLQVSGAISSTLFAELSPASVIAFRLAIGAAVMCAVFRPSLRNRSRDEWVGIFIYGAAMAAMAVTLAYAIDRLPLGVAVTLDFLGPCAVALIGANRVRDGICAIVALAGVALISLGPGGYFDLAGYIAGFAAAAATALYIIFAARVGKSSSGLDGVALSVLFAAVLTAPLGVPHVANVTAHHLGIITLAAVVGVVVPYVVDTIAGKLTSAQVLGTLFAIDPALAALAGFVILGEAMSVPAMVGIALVMLSGALLVSGSRDGGG